MPTAQGPGEAAVAGRVSAASRGASVMAAMSDEGTSPPPPHIVTRLVKKTVELSVTLEAWAGPGDCPVTLEARDGALVITAVAAGAGGRLQPGDCVTALDGAPVGGSSLGEFSARPSGTSRVTVTREMPVEPPLANGEVPVPRQGSGGVSSSPDTPVDAGTLPTRRLSGVRTITPDPAELDDAAALAALGAGDAIEERGAGGGGVVLNMEILTEGGGEAEAELDEAQDSFDLRRASEGAHHMHRYNTAPVADPEQPKRRLSVQHARPSLPVVLVDNGSRSAQQSPRESPHSSDENLTDASQCSTPKLEHKSRGFKNWAAAKRLVQAYRTFSARGRYPWVQLAGHADGFLECDSDEWILKLCTQTEQTALTEAHAEGLKGAVPDLAGVQDHEGKQYLQLENLLHNFTNPNIMDVKIGLRTFLESELSPKPRIDLLKKLVALDPDYPSIDERLQGVTKLRYMQFRENLSSTSTLGFRIEALRVNSASDKDLKTVKGWDEVKAKFNGFTMGRQDIIKVFVKRLKELRVQLAASEFFKHHEIVGSSILFVFDKEEGHADATMIDFGKTKRRDVEIKHDVPWVSGANSLEDGYLIGLDNLIRIFSQCVADPPGSPAKVVLRTAMV